MVTINTSNKNVVSRDILSSRFIWDENNNLPQTIVGGLKASEAIQEVRRKVSTGEYAFEHVRCFCGAQDDILVSEIDRYGFYYPIVICKRCGLMRANPRMSREAYVQFYSHEYRDVYGEGDKNLDSLFERRMKQAREKYEFFTQSIDIPNRGVVFEIGCDFGTMLLPFADAGCDVYGCDYGSEHIEYGREKLGLENFFIGGVEELLKTGRKADFIILKHVVEHFYDLEDSLHKIHSMLNQNGCCYIAIPGLYKRVRNSLRGNNNILSLLQNAHTYQFTLKTVQYVMECCGFEFLKGDEGIEAFFKFSDQYREKTDYYPNECSMELEFLKRVEEKFSIRNKIVSKLNRIGLKKNFK